MPIGSGIVYNTGDLILSQVSSSGTAFLETKIAAATSSLIYFDSTARINSASLNSITVGTASYVSGSRSIITNLTASNISASGTGSFGMVGIGTTNPNYKLHVEGTSFFNNTISSSNKLIIESTQPGIILRETDQIGTTHRWIDVESGTFRILQTNNDYSSFTTQFVINSSGNVGIGSSSPGALLEISSSTAASLLNVKGAGGNGLLFVSGSGNVGIGTTSPVYKLQVGGLYQSVNTNLISITDTSHIYRGTPDGSGWEHAKIYSGRDDTTYSYGSYLAFYTEGKNSGTTDTSVERIRINSVGNVGIGTSVPGALLHVYTGSIGGTAYPLLIDNNSGGAGVNVVGFGFANGGIMKHSITTAIYGNDYMAFNVGQGASYNQERMRIDSSGNVGIGTTNPLDKLSVSGSIGLYAAGTTRIYNAINATDSISIEGGSGITFKTYSGGFNTVMFINTAGNVGIGTTSPLEAITFGASNSIIARSSATTFNSGYCSRILFNQGGTGYGYLGFYTYEGGSGGGERMRISENGNVGIGTTNPVAKLQVSGSISGSSFTSSVSNAVGFLGTASWAQNVVSSSYATTAQTANALNSANSYTITNLTASNISASGTISASKLYVIGTANVIELVQAAVGSATYYVMDNTVETGGRRYRFGYSGGSSDKGSFTIYNQTDNITPFTITTSGSVGIGTTVPGTLFQVFKAANGNNWSWFNGNVGANLPTGFTTGVSIGTNYSNGFSESNLIWGHGVSSNQYFAIGKVSGSTSYSEQLRIDINGNVGIGTTSPTARLHVSGSTGGVFEVDTAGGTTTLYVSASGNVGIGTTGPAQKLDVRGYVVSDVGSNAVEGGFYLGNGNHGLRRPGGSSNDVYLYTTSGTLYMGASGNSSQHLTILTGGNVGIGTTSPSNKTTIDADATGVSFADNGVAQLVIRGTTDTTKRLGLGVDTTNNIGVIQAQKYGTAAYPLALNPVGGNVGIGTTAPAYLLDVSGSSRHGYRTSDAHFFTGSVNISGSLNATASWATNALTASFLPVGTYNITASWANNVVSASYATTAQTANALNVSNTYTVAGLTSGNVNVTGTTIPSTGIYRPASKTLGLSADTTLILKIDGTGAPYVTSIESGNFLVSGDVGIGTAAPGAKLEISGSSNSVLLNIKSPISGAILYVSGSGAVGIGTTAVGAFTLQVSGSFGATTKSFIIDHPTKAGKKLMYGSLESPYHGIRLTGRDTLVNGKCKIQLPDYMYKLILHDSVNIQLTGIKCNKTLYIDDINIPENYFTIAYDKAIFESYKDYDFFWDFTAIRADVPELQTEM